MAGIESLTSIGSPSILALLWTATVPATVAGVIFFVLAEAAATQANPSRRDRRMRWLVLVPVAALLLLGASAAIDAADQASWHAACLRAGVPFCQPATPTLFLGSAIWILGCLALLGCAQLADSVRGRRVFGSGPLAVALAVVLGVNLVLGMGAGFLSIQPAFYDPTDWVVIRTLLLLYVTAGLLWTGIATLCGFRVGEWAFAARLLAWMNLVPTSFVAFGLGLSFLGGAWPSGL